MTGLGVVIAGGALACTAGAAVADVRRFEIPDAWSIAIVGLFALFAANGMSFGDFWPHALVGIGVFAVGALLFDRGWLGGGDVKLLAAVAVWSGTGGLLALIGGTVFAGGLLALLALVGRRLAGATASYPALQKDGPLPYAVAILAGAAASIPLAG